MIRSPFVLKLKEGKKAEGIAAMKGAFSDIKNMLDQKGVGNFSVWGIENFLFCYYVKQVFLKLIQKQISRKTDK